MNKIDPEIKFVLKLVFSAIIFVASVYLCFMGILLGVFASDSGTKIAMFVSHVLIIVAIATPIITLVASIMALKKTKYYLFALLGPAFYIATLLIPDYLSQLFGFR